MMNFFFVFITLFSPVVMGQNVTGGKILSRHPVEGRPNYFFKVNDGGNLISFSRAKVNDTRGFEPGTNHILDVSTGSVKDIPGPYDPVFFPLSKLMVFKGDIRGDANYEVFAVPDLLQGIVRPVSTIPNLPGYYQSTGLLGIKDGIHHYRVIAENHSLAHVSVDFTYDPVRGNIDYINPEVKGLLCSETKIKLPMLSKDGRFLGGLDLQTQTSGVWRIKDDLSCEKILDLGIKTGKLNFNYESDKLTYHLYRKVEAKNVWDDQSQNYVGVPENTFVSDVFVYDIRLGVVSKITSNYANNSMYPDFTRDGRLVFISHPHKDEEARAFVFVRVR